MDWIARAWGVVGLLAIGVTALLVLAKHHEGSVDLIAGVACAVTGVSLLKIRGAPGVVPALGCGALIAAGVIAFHVPIEQTIDGPARHTAGAGARLAGGSASAGSDRSSKRGASAKAHSRASHKTPQQPHRHAVASVSGATTQTHAEPSVGSSGAPSLAATDGDKGAYRKVQDRSPPKTTHLQPPHETQVPHATVEEAGEARPVENTPAVKVESTSERSHGPVIESN